ncbi:hypothetical protein MRX96_037474 [Rhipicephalus microplus]
MFRQHAPAWAEQRRILDFQCFGAPAVFPRMRAPCSSRGDGLKCVASPLQFPRCVHDWHLVKTPAEEQSIAPQLGQAAALILGPLTTRHHLRQNTSN